MVLMRRRTNLKGSTLRMDHTAMATQRHLRLVECRPVYPHATALDIDRIEKTREEMLKLFD